MTDVTLRYVGALADNNELDLYDAARGLLGFQRSLALTTHLVLNGEIITQSPSLKGAQIITSTPESGSWKVTATILAGIWAAGTATKETPLGHLIFSVYDYAVSETMGFHVDYDKSLGEQYEEELKEKKITKEKIDSLIEKTEGAISDIHRPIIGSNTANSAEIIGTLGRDKPIRLGPTFSNNTYEYISHTKRAKEQTAVNGKISSYNTNTFKGRIYDFNEMRPIPFELLEAVRTRQAINAITSSLRSNAISRGSESSVVQLQCYRLESSTGRLKSLLVSEIR